ncbi:MAG: trehalose-phosphatase [Steroidobacteraceae bacterium]|nr:trehalose-phosphatase [Steroidobacteraceae bacterium]
MPTDRAATFEPIETLLAPGQRPCLFLDFDGTLLELAETPDAIHVDPGLPALLARVHEALGGALALVSGRTLDELDALLAPLRLPAAGVHGYERRDALGTVHRAPARRDALEPARHRFVQLVATDPRLLLEDKGEALALHYRRAPGRGAELRAFAAQVLEALPEGFALQPGDMVVEIKSRLFTKGSAVRDFLREPPFLGRQPVVIGDDFTDLDAFRVVEYLGGLSIAVGGRISGRERMSDPAQVRRLLAVLAERAAQAPAPGVTAHA